MRLHLPRPVLAALAVAVAVPLAGPALADGPVAGSAGPTELRISAPSSVPAGSSPPVSVRLVSRSAEGGEEGVRDEPVVLQRRTASGWAQVTSLTTRDGGLGRGPVPVGATSRYRAVYRGDDTHTPSTSREVVVAATSTLGDRAVAEAKRHQGAPYSYGAAGPSSFDCSGLTMYVFGKLGHSLPHNADAQYRAIRHIANADKRPGDLIFGYHGSAIGHVGIYAGGSQMWAAVQSGDVVRLQSFAGRAYSVGRVG